MNLGMDGFAIPDLGEINGSGLWREVTYEALYNNFDVLRVLRDLDSDLP
jgi:hypothetical protein